jgi:NTP pyrophosphatase (non-canonical NTP hydrolase)
MKKTNFEKVIEFNKCFGLPHYNNIKKNIIIDNPKLTKLRLALITEENEELHDAVEKNDFIEIIDALADLLYVVYGAGSSFGIDLDKAFNLVHKSNMTKLCKTKTEAINTVSWYKKNETRYDSPNYRKSDNDQYWVVYNESTGKILKSIGYKPVDLTIIK